MWPDLRHADAEDCIEHNSANLQFLQDQLQTLQGRLSAKYREQEALVAVATKAKLLVVRRRSHATLELYLYYLPIF